MPPYTKPRKLAFFPTSQCSPVWVEAMAVVYGILGYYDPRHETEGWPEQPTATEILKGHREAALLEF